MRQNHVRLMYKLEKESVFNIITLKGVPNLREIIQGNKNNHNEDHRTTLVSPVH